MTSEYAYSGLFNYVGNGTVLPDGEAPASTSTAAAASSAATDAATEGSA